MTQERHALIDDYVLNKEERDEEYYNEEQIKELEKNIRSLHGSDGEIDTKLLSDQLKALKQQIEEEDWPGMSFVDILSEVIIIQNEQFLGLHEIADILVFIKWNPEKNIDYNGKAFNEKLIKQIINNTINKKDFHEILSEVDSYPIHILEKVFSNMSMIDEQSAVDYFKALNEAILNHELKRQLLIDISTKKQNFQEAKVSLYLMKIERALRSRNLSEKLVLDACNCYQILVQLKWSVEDFYSSIDVVLKMTLSGHEESAVKILCRCFHHGFDYGFDASDFLKTVQETKDRKHRIYRKNEIKWTEADLRDLEIDFHEKALEKFGKTHEKSLDELIKEIAHANSWHGTSKAVDLKEDYLKVMTAMTSPSNTTNQPIESCLRSETVDWVQRLKRKEIVPDRSERVAFVVHSFNLFKGFEVRTVQLLSLLLLYKPEAGTLAQINTGEGKTGIIAMLATLFALEGRKVDIVTSSPELAGPQAEELKKFYDNLEITSCHIKGKTKAYECDVIYGSIDDYEADVLRDEYSLLGTRCKRPFDIAIVDEVDSMLIDGSNFMVRLTTPTPGMDELEPILAAIWIHLELVASKIIEQNGIAYCEDPDNDDCLIPLNVTKSEFIKSGVEDHMRLLMRDEGAISEANKPLLREYPEMQVPTYLRDFILQNRLTLWISSAIQARFYYTNGVDYIIRGSQIKIVDVTNTGVVHQNMSYGDGLHQFLQLKHGAQISSENLTTNYLANTTFFMRYGKNIYGLSGTLGSEESKKFLVESYGVKLIEIPPFKLKKHIQLSPIIRCTKDDWYISVVNSLLPKLKNGRACLIIAESIKEAEAIEEKFKNIKTKCKILMYTTDECKSVIAKPIAAKEVIISTNVAGRGTDIKLTDEVNENGGLHLCLTFLPTNDRVELQNLGRTSRTGQPGTSQFVLLSSSSSSLAELQSKRDIRNLFAFMTAAKDMDNIKMRAKVFQEFCSLLSVFKGSDENYMSLQCRAIKSNDCSAQVLRIAVEERFGLWLKCNEKLINESENYLQSFEKFKTQIEDDAKSGKLVKNPYHYVKSGNDFVKSEKFDKAIEQYTRAIKIDPHYAANPYYNRGYALVACYKNSIKSEKIEDAIADFKKAREILEQRKEELGIIQQCCKGEDSTELSEQVFQKSNLLEFQISAINLAIGYDKDLLRKQIEDLEKHKKNVSKEISDFVELDNLKSESSIFKAELDAHTGDKDGLDKLKNKQCEIESKVLNFKDKETLTENIKEIEESIKDLNKKIIEEGVIQSARTKNKDIEVKLVKLEDSLEEKFKSYEEAIKEFERNGYLGSFQVSEKCPIDWLSVSGVLAIGLGQLIAGAAIAIFSYGSAASVGIGILMEGISDVITAVRDGIINRNFSWKSWGLMKAISYTVSIVCAGLSSLKNIAKHAYSAAKGIASTTTKVITGSVKAGWKIAAKKIGIELSKGVAKEVANGLVNLGLDKMVMEEIEKQVYKIVQPVIENFLLKDPTVKIMLQLDEINKNYHFESLIRTAAMEILNSPENQNFLKSYALGVAEGIGSQNFVVGKLITVVKTGCTFYELATFVKKFIDKLKTNLEKQASEANLEEKLTQFKDSETTSQHHETQQDYNFEANNNFEEKDDIDLNLLDKRDEEQIKHQYRKSDQSSLVDKITNTTSARITNIIKGKIITPVTSALVAKGVGKLSSSLDKALNKEIGEYQSERRLIQAANNDPEGLLDESYKENHKDPKTIEKVEALINDTKRESDLGLIHMRSICAETGCFIEVLNEKGEIMFTVGERKEGQKIVRAEFHPESGDNKSGHWTLPGNKEAKSLGSTTHDCLLNVICAQTSGDPDELRAKVADNMAQNKNWIANSMGDYTNLENNMKKGLYQGGASFEKGDINEVIEHSQNNKSHNSENKNGKHSVKGHPKGHMPDPTAPNDPGATDCIQNYSRRKKPGKTVDKTTFESKETFKETADQLLCSPKAKLAFEQLNNGAERSDLTFTPEEVFEITGKVPLVHHYDDGKLTRTSELTEVYFYLRHRSGEVKNKDAKVHIQTAYPVGTKAPPSN